MASFMFTIEGREERITGNGLDSRVSKMGRVGYRNELAMIPVFPHAPYPCSPSQQAVKCVAGRSFAFVTK